MGTQRTPSLLPALAPLSVLRILWKRKYSILFVWMVISAATYFVVKRIPSVYEAQAVVLVDSQKIPDQYVAPTVSDVQDRLATISLEILSNQRLQEIVNRFNLYRDERQKYPMEKIFGMMRKDIEIAPEKAWTGRTPSFHVRFQGRDPVVVAQVANWIAEMYVNGDARLRESQALGTSQFIDSQLKEAKQKLDQLEAAVSEYKLKHNGELPEQEASLNASLNRLQVELEANRDALNRAQESKTTLQDALNFAESNERIQERELRLADSLTAGPKVKPPTRREQLEAELAGYRARGYTNEHPDVKRVLAELAQIPKTNPKAPVETAAEREADRIANSPEILQARARIAALKSQLAGANQELVSGSAEQRRILSEIASYQSKIASLPIREQQMAQLTRDYQFSKENYQKLLDKKISAGMAADMEMRQKSERFMLADPALVPIKPFKPKRALFDVGGAIFGLILGVVVAFGRELHEGMLLGEWELPTGVRILGRVPVIGTGSGASVGPENARKVKGGRPSAQTGVFGTQSELS